MYSAKLFSLDKTIVEQSLSNSTSHIINRVNISFLITADAISFKVSLLHWEGSVHVNSTDLGKKKFSKLNKVILICGIRVMSAASSERSGLLLNKTEGQLLSLF